MTLDIDMIVRQVLDDLRQRPEVSSGTTESSVDPPVTLPEAVHRLFLADSPVVSMADLRDRLEGVRELLVAPRTILTPAVRDELRRLKIDVVRETTTAPGGKTLSDKRIGIWLATQRPLQEPVRLIDFLKTRSELLYETFPGVGEIVDRLIANLEQRHAIVLSSDAVRVLCHAHRHGAVWGVQGFEPKQTARDAEAVGANLLVLDPLRHTNYRQLEIIKAFWECVSSKSSETSP